MLKLARVRTLTTLGLLAPVVFGAAACKSETNAESSASESSPTASESAGATGEESGDTGAQTCDPTSPEGLMWCVDAQAYDDHLSFVAEPRAPQSSHWMAVQDYADTHLAGLGYSVERRNYGTGINLIASRPGTDLASEIVLISAHYDSRGCGDAACTFPPESCNGADDNATGVAAALELARVFADVPTRRTIMIALWDEEEIGLLGAEAFVAALPTTQENIHLLLNWDSIGFASNEPNSQQIPNGFDLVFPAEVAEVEANEYRADFIVAAADDSAVSTRAVETFESLGESTGLSAIGLILIEGLAMSPLAADLRRSDHAPFWDAAIPAVFITDSTEFRNDHYHCGEGQDAITDLDLEFAVRVTQATVAAAADAAELAG